MLFLLSSCFCSVSMQVYQKSVLDLVSSLEERFHLLPFLYASFPHTSPLEAVLCSCLFESAHRRMKLIMVSMHTCSIVHTHIHVHVHAHTHIICTYNVMYCIMHTHTYPYTCMYMYMYMYIHKHICTHTGPCHCNPQSVYSIPNSLLL